MVNRTPHQGILAPNTTTYLDTSAAMKLIVAEQESAPLRRGLASEKRILVSSWLLHTELHCAAGRHPNDVNLETVSAVLDRVVLVDLTRGDLLSASTHTPLRSNDAMHLAVALRLGVDEIVTYDRELAEAAHQAGLHSFAPS